MARSTTTSDPTKLFTAPFIEFTITHDEVNQEFFRENPNHGVNLNTHNTASPFMLFATILNIFGKNTKLMEGDRESYDTFRGYISTGQYQSAFELMASQPADAFWDLQFPWMQLYNARGKFKELEAIYGMETLHGIRNICKGIGPSVLFTPGLRSLDVMSRFRTRVSIHNQKYSDAFIRYDTIYSDIWIPQSEQGVRIDGTTRKFTDLSEGPFGVEGLSNSDTRSFGFFAGNTAIPNRIMNPNMSLAQNMMFNMCLQLIHNRVSSLNTWNKYQEGFFSRVRSNVPLGMFLGQQLCVVEGVPVMLLHSDPSEAYSTFKTKTTYGHQLRWTGIQAAPNRQAKVSGTAATLSLVSKKTRVSRKRSEKGFRLFDRETTEQLADALDLHPCVVPTHDLLNEYLRWYQNLRDTARKIVKQKEGEAPKWGRWGFKPLAFSGYPGNARVFIKLVEG